MHRRFGTLMMSHLNLNVKKEFEIYSNKGYVLHVWHKLANPAIDTVTGCLQCLVIAFKFKGAWLVYNVFFQHDPQLFVGYQRDP